MSPESEPSGSRNEEKLGLRSVQAIEESRNRLLGSREEIRKYVEAPLVSACEEFYDKNIQTLSSSCNAKDLQEGRAYIIIDYDHLSPANQKIASAISAPILYDDMQAVKIEIPITQESTVDEISQGAREIAARFEKQPATWVPTYTFDEMKAILGIADDDSQYKPQDFTEATEEGSGYYWDEATQLYYPSEELFRKATEDRR